MVSAMLVLERHLQLRERNGQWYKNILGWAAPEKRNIDLLFYSFFDQVWKMVVYMLTEIWIVDIHFTQGKFWRNKLFFPAQKQYVHIGQTLQVYKNTHLKISILPYIKNSLSFLRSNEWIIFCTYNKVFCHTYSSSC